jgi:molybdopterin/thiamine biosynthesis adenylyltransferase
MILSKDQINRYLRHILIPEISSLGQKKITESKIYLYASTVQDQYQQFVF